MDRKIIASKQSFQTPVLHQLSFTFNAVTHSSIPACMPGLVFHSILMSMANKHLHKNLQKVITSRPLFEIPSPKGPHQTTIPTQQKQ